MHYENKPSKEKKGNSFVIYGEPQSGKTELMIALTCKLLDCGFKTIFIVVNDNTELENQNLKIGSYCKREFLIVKQSPCKTKNLS